MATFDVCVEHEAVVVPCLPSPESTLYLDNIDQQVFFHVEVLFFYGGKKHDSDLFQTFHDSLAMLLVPYHFAAGRLRVNEQQGRLELLCNRAGALLAGARSTKPLSVLGDITAPNPDFRTLFHYGPPVDSIEQLPILTVQVTEFACGGIVIAFRASHVVFDGVELNTFFSNYAQIFRGDTKLHLVLKLDHDKTHLKPNDDMGISAEHKEMISLPDVPAKVLFTPEDYLQSSNPVLPDHIFETFRFTPEILASLKARAVEDGLVEWCSTFEALTAHVWQCRSKVLGIESPESPSKLFVVVNTRKKLPSLPAGFVGNSIITAPCVEVSYREVSEKPFSFCVKKVQETIRNADAKYIRSFVSWCEGRHGAINLKGGILISTWSKLGFDLIDFGFGRPAYVASLVRRGTETVTVFSSCTGDGGLDVLLALEVEKMDIFRNHVLNF